MAITLLNSANLRAYIARIEALRENTEPRWGQLRPAAMLAHLTITARLSLGEISAQDRSNIFTRHILRRLAYSPHIRWPKGTIKVPPEFTPDSKLSVDEERARLIPLLERFVAASEREPERKGLHPMFGPLTLKYWQQVHGKHLNHHCEQFGL